MLNWSDDIYFCKEYGYVNEVLELGKSVHYVLECEHGKIVSTFIKRRIPLLGNDEDYYDIRSPYGYGGPLVVECADKEKLIEAYRYDFKEYCEKNNIITEFVRFHPMAGNAHDFKGIYDVFFDRFTVGTNLGISDNPLEMEFSKSCKKNIRRALNKGLYYKVIEHPENLLEFKAIYYETMDRNNAEKFYYFNDEYFDRLLKCFSEKLLVIYAIFDDKIVAAGLYFVSHDTLHIHLSGTLDDYLILNPPYVLRYAAAEWALQHGVKYIHHGGGRTNREDDSLYIFKKQFGINTDFEYYIGEKVWNMKVYNELLKLLKPGEKINDYIRRFCR